MQQTAADAETKTLTAALSNRGMHDESREPLNSTWSEGR